MTFQIACGDVEVVHEARDDEGSRLLVMQCACGKARGSVVVGPGDALTDGQGENLRAAFQFIHER